MIKITAAGKLQNAEQLISGYDKNRILSAQQPELAFKTSAPDLIVLTDEGQVLAVSRGSAFSFFIRHQAFALEDIADSAGSGYGEIVVMIEQPHPQFFRPQPGCFDAGQSGVSRYHQEPCGNGNLAHATGPREMTGQKDKSVETIYSRFYG